MQNAIKFLVFLFVCIFSLTVAAKTQKGKYLDFDFSKKPIKIPAGVRLLPYCSHPLKDKKDFLSCALKLNQLSRVMAKRISKGEVQFSVYIPAIIPKDIQSRKMREHSSSFLSQSQDRLEERMILFQPQRIGSLFWLLKPKLVVAEEVPLKGEKIVYADIDDVQLNVDSLAVEQETVVLPAVSRKKALGYSGCFVVPKKEEMSKEEAEFCLTCLEKKRFDNPSRFTKGLQRIVKGFSRIKATEGAVFQDTLSGGDFTQKICSPTKSLEKIIEGFNDSCPEPYQDHFKDFFDKAYCQSCHRGVSPEIVLAMMSMNPKGMCNLNRQEKFPPFKVDPNTHQCRDEQGKTYVKNAKKVTRCLKNPVNHLNTGLDILIGFYKEVNDDSSLSPGKCKAWVDMTPEERDNWRRSVSSLQSEDPRLMEKALDSVLDEDLINLAGKVETWKEHGIPERYLLKEGKKVDWEQLRFLLLVESIVSVDVLERFATVKFPLKALRTAKRSARRTFKDLVFTEAVLGREIKDNPLSAPGGVEIWSQYVEEHKPASCSGSIPNVKMMEFFSPQARSSQ